MLVPLGLEVMRDAATGALIWNDGGHLCLRVSSGVLTPVAGRGTTPPKGGGSSHQDAEVDPEGEGTTFKQTLEVVSGAAAPDTMGFSASRGQGEHIRKVPESRPNSPIDDTDITISTFPAPHVDPASDHSSKSTNEQQNAEIDEDRFAVRRGNFLHGSGVFFALKIQSAATAKQMEEFVCETENLRRLQGEGSIVQIKDVEICEDRKEVLILMELALCDLSVFLTRSDYSLDVADMLNVKDGNGRRRIDAN